MFVVHTVNQLEEAVRVGAEEILVTGGLVNNVHEAFRLKVCQQGRMQEQEEPSDENCNIDQSAQRMGVPVWGLSSLMMITHEYALLNSRIDSQSPCMILQRSNPQ